MEVNTNQLKLIGVLEFCVGLILVIIFGPLIESGIPSETTLKIIIQSAVTLLGIGICLYGLIQVNTHSDKALVPLFMWFVVIVSASMLLDIVFTQDIQNLNLLYISRLVAFISLAIPLVIAIRKDKSDIVPLSVCFAILYFIDSFWYDRISVVILRLIWSIGWLIYFLCSKKLELVYPKKNRTSCKWAICVVVIYCVMFLFYPL